MTDNVSENRTENETEAAGASEFGSEAAGLNVSSGDFVAMSRRLALSAKRVIGFLPAIARTTNQDLPMLETLARGLTAFVVGDVGVVHDWRANSNSAPASGWAPDAKNPRVIHLTNAGVPDRASAAPALRRVLGECLPKLSRVLVDLSDYAEPGVLPGATDLMDGVVIWVPARRARWKRVAELVRSVPGAMQLGAIVID